MRRSCLAGAASFVLVFAPLVHANTLLVPEHYTLEVALAAAQAGDTVSVADHTLDGGDITVDRPITLLSRVTGGNRIQDLIVSPAADPVAVVGFHIGYDTPLEGVDHTDEYQGMVILAAHAGFTDCLIQGLVPWQPYGEGNPVAAPVYLDTGSEVTFTRCTFRGNISGGDWHGEILPAECIIQIDGGAAGALRIDGCMFEGQTSPIIANVPVEIIDSTFQGCSGYLVTAYHGLTISGSVISDFKLTERSDCAFSECFEYTSMIRAAGEVQIHNNTFVDTGYEYLACGCPYPTPQQVPALVLAELASSGSITNNLFVGQPGAAVDAPSTVTVACNDAFQSGDVNWRGGIGDVTGIDGNFSAPPLFCDRANGDYTLSVHSPAAPDNSGDCGLIGALPTACETQVATLVRLFHAVRAAQDPTSIHLTFELNTQIPVILRRITDADDVEIYRGVTPRDRIVEVSDAQAPAGPVRYALGTESDDGRFFPFAWADAETDVATSPTNRSRLMGASPNPFNPQTVVSFEVVATAVQQAVPVTLTVRDLAGREVLRLVDEVLPPGTYHQLWEGDDASGRKVASGVYLASLTIDGRLIGTQKLALIR